MARPGQPGAGPPRQPPISFKTVPGRNRTQKWNQAKTYNYDGDDWGGYDPYDEYGGDINDASAMASGPYPQPGLQRQQSFETGSERRQFSGPQPAYHQDDRSRSPAKSTGSSGYSDPMRRRDYSNPTQVPPPLNTRSSPARPVDSRSRKSSMSSEHAPADAISPISAKSDKPLPFIRPSDIYKRMAEEKERERQSSESSRPSMDSIQREGTPASAAGSSQRPLSTVQERPGSGDISTLVQHDSPDLHPGFGASAGRPMLPPVGAVSDFGLDVLRAADSTTQNVTRAPPAQSHTDPTHQEIAPPQPNYATSAGQQPASAIDRQTSTASSQYSRQPEDLSRTSTTTGLRNVVQTAFDRQDSTASSQKQPTEVSRSNTDSTSSISPIMSRVPSTAAAFQRQQDWDTSVPPIAEEPTSSHSRSASGETVVAPSHQRFGSLTHAANAPEPSADSPYRRSVNASSPAQSSSPARTPGLETVEPERVSNSMSGQIATDTNTEIRPGRPRRGTDYSIREADLAREASSATSPVQNQELAQTQEALQSDFLHEHASTPHGAEPGPSSNTGAISSAPPQDSAAISPTSTLGAPSHPQENGTMPIWTSTLAAPTQPQGGAAAPPTAPTQLQERASTVSTLSPTSPQSGATIPSTTSTLAAPTQPSRLNSFQPHMPGEWVSPAPTPAVEASQPSFAPTAPLGRSRLVHDSTPEDKAEDDEEVPDFSPTTSRNAADSNVGGAIAAVKDAGAALGAALLSNVGLGHQTRDFASEAPSKPVEQPAPHPRNQIGDITSRYPLTREISDVGTEGVISVASDAPPTPPAKDDTLHPVDTNSYFGSARGPSPLNQQHNAQEERPALPTNTSNNSDYESDRLRKDIERSLNEHVGAASVDPVKAVHRDNDALEAPKNQERVAAGLTALPPAEAQPDARHGLPSSTTRPGFLDQRFSWESTHEVVNKPTMPIALVGELPGDKGRQSYERPPDGHGLHVVNAPHEELVSPVSAVSPISPIQQSTVPQSLSIPAGESIKRNELSPSPVSLDDSSHIPSYYAGVTGAPIHVPSTSVDEAEPPLHGEQSTARPEQDSRPSAQPANTDTSSAPRAYSSGQAGRIPPFREILAIKEAPERIKTYADTRQNFAEMNTGLNKWMSGLLAKHPEHSELVTPTGALNAQSVPFDGGSMGRGHRHNPSILKIKQFTSSSDPVRSDVPPETPPKDYPDGSRQQMEKMQAKGKDLMKTASAFGGKAQAGAMGLLAKGRSRFGRGDKAKAPPPISTSERRPSRPLSSPVLAEELARDFTGANHAATFGEKSTNRDPETDQVIEGAKQSKQAEEGTPPTTSAQQNETDTEARPGLLARLRRRSRSLSRSLSRPNSMALAEDGTEIKKTRTHSRSRSRPSSLILLSSNRSEDASNKPAVQEDVPAVPSLRQDTTTPVTKTRTEAWENAEALPRVSEGNEEGSGRLGVLPSPSTFTFSEYPTSPAKPRRDSLAARLAEREDLRELARPDTGRSSIVDEEPVPRLKTPDKSSNVDGVVFLSKRGRQSSDLSTLPSQQKTVPPVPMWPRHVVEDSSSSSSAYESAKQHTSAPQAALATHDGVSVQDHADSLPRDSSEQSMAWTDAVEHQPIIPPTVVENAVAGAGAAREIPAERPSVAGNAAVHSIDQSPVLTKTSIGSSTVGSAPVAHQPGPLQEEARSVQVINTPRLEDQAALFNHSKVSSAPALAHQHVPFQEDARNLHVTDTSRDEDQAALFDSSSSEPALAPQHVQSQEDAGHIQATHTPRFENQTALMSESDQLSPEATASFPQERSLTSKEPQPSATQAHGSTPMQRVYETEQVVGASNELNTTSERLLPKSTLNSSSPQPVLPVSDTATKGAMDPTGAMLGPAVSSDSRSVVSAEDRIDADADKRSVKSNRSAVSSLGEPETNGTATIIQPSAKNTTASAPVQVDSPLVGMSSQAGPAGPFAIVFKPLDDLDIVPALRVSQELSRPGSGVDRFANRQYKAQQGRSRPMSFSPLPRDELGRPQQESIDQISRPLSAIDLSDYAGQPAGVPPTQKHPLLREEDQGGVLATTKRDSAKPRLSATVFPSSSQIDDQYGLEDAQVSSPVDELTMDEATNKKSKRRSGFWDSFRGASSSGLLDDGAKSNASPVPGDPRRRSIMGISPKPMEQGQRPNTLKKPQRSSSTAVEPEIKKRRFSGLGSLFGRSNTQGHAGPKPNKLAKKAPLPQDRQMTIEHPAQGYYRQPTAPVNYEEFEAARRREAAQQEAMAAASFSQVPPHEYYGGDSPPEPPRKSPKSPQPQYLQEESYWHDRFRNVPEAFRPVEASFGRTTTVGPPMERNDGRQVSGASPEGASRPSWPERNDIRQSAASPVEVSRPSWPLRGDSLRYEQARMASRMRNGSSEPYGSVRPHPQRAGSSQVSRGSGAMSPPIAGRADYDAANSLSPTFSPVEGRFDHFHSHPAYQQADIARSPAREYGDQQTPWPVTLPSQERGPVQARTTDTYTALPTFIDPGSPSQHDSYIQQSTERPSSGYNSRDVTNVPTHAGLSPLYNRGNGWTDPYASGQQGLPRYSRDPSHDQYMRPRQHYEAQMRGASYPGQEWMPAVHGL